MQRHESNCPVAVATVTSTVSRLNPVLIILVVNGGGVVGCCVCLFLDQRCCGFDYVSVTSGL